MGIYCGFFMVLPIGDIDLDTPCNCWPLGDLAVHNLACMLFSNALQRLTLCSLVTPYRRYDVGQH